MLAYDGCSSLQLKVDLGEARSYFSVAWPFNIWEENLRTPPLPPGSNRSQTREVKHKELVLRSSWRRAYLHNAARNFDKPAKNNNK